MFNDLIRPSRSGRRSRAVRGVAIMLGALLVLSTVELGADRRGGGSVRQTRSTQGNAGASRNNNYNRNTNVNRNVNNTTNVNRNVNVNNNVNVNRNVNVNSGYYGRPRGGVVAGEEGAVAVGRRGAVAVGEEGFVGVGRYGDDLLTRAVVARVGWGANVPEEAVYPIARADAGGAPLDGAKTYRIRFPAGGLPPVEAFWSLSVYGEDMFFTEHPSGRYSIGDRTPDLAFGEDASSVHLGQGPTVMALLRDAAVSVLHRAGAMIQTELDAFGQQLRHPTTDFHFDPFVNDISAQWQWQALIGVAPPLAQILTHHQALVLISQLAFMNDEADIRRARTNCLKNLIERHDDEV